MPPRRWSPRPFPLGDLDRLLLGLCSPEPRLPPMWVHPEPLLQRAAALDVFPLVFHRLRHSPRWLPDKVSSHWEDRFRANAARNLALESEQRRLLAALADACLRPLPLKGIRLARLAYGDPALRSQLDIDLYVPPPQLAAALQVLTAHGFRRRGPATLPGERLAATGDLYTSQCFLESTLAAQPVLLELHWRLLPVEDRELEAAIVSTADAAALSVEWEFLYLCVHASADRWGTLKSLVDLAHLLVRRPPDWDRLLATAERLGLRRILYATLSVVQDHVDVPVPPTVLERLASARPRAMPREALANPFAPFRPLSPAATHRLRWHLRERFRDRLGYAFHLLRPTAGDLAAVGLPARWSFLYWGLRWLRLAGWLNADRKYGQVAGEA